MQSSVLAEAAAAGIRLVISVDTGIRAVAEAAEARVLDLTSSSPTITSPTAWSPSPTASPSSTHQPGCTYPCKNLCGAAVVFKLAQALLAAAAPLTADPDAFRTRTRSVLIPSFLKLVAIAPSPTPSPSPAKTGRSRL